MTDTPPHDAPLPQDPSLPVWGVTPATFAQIDLPAAARSFAQAVGYTGEAGKLLAVPNDAGGVAGFLYGLPANGDPFAAGALPALLPSGRSVRLEGGFHPLSALAFGLGAYRFDRYRAKAAAPGAKLDLPPDADPAALARTLGAVTLVRDLVNTPSNDMGPDELEAAARALGEAHGATVTVITGEDLLARNFPMIHAVGRASVRAPRLIDLVWGDPAHPRLTLVGKGVCFDTGGLDIKPSAGMLLMKKDMGGAAHALGLAYLVMARGLKVRLRLLIPAVENSISGDAFRPGDVLSSRKGISVEIGNTDAEGRLVLADAMTLADEEAPDLMIDFATLTGAARVAVGPQIAPFYTADEALAAALQREGEAQNDPVWRLPLHAPYAAMLESKVADINNAGTGGFAGSITAALFLKRFVEAAGSWLHFDIYAWNASARPGRPEGGEAQAIRALEALLAARYG